MKNALATLLVAFAGLLAQPALAQQQIVSFAFAGCTDALNRPVASRAEASLPALVNVVLEEGNRVIVYNPTMMPHLLSETRAFFYADACAIVRLGLPINRELSAEQSRRADCAAFDMLRRSGLLKGNTAAAIRTDMEISPEVWPLVPGEPRSLDPAQCGGAGRSAAAPARADNAEQPEQRARGNVLKLDEANASPAWDACTQSCGNRLFTCGRGASCQAAFDQCVKGCTGK